MNQQVTIEEHPATPEMARLFEQAEREYGLRSETFYAAYTSGEEPEDESWVLDFAEWASVYRTWLARQAEYRNEVQRLQRNGPSLVGLI